MGRSLLECCDAKEMLVYQHSGLSVDGGLCVLAHDCVALERLRKEGAVLVYRSRGWTVVVRRWRTGCKSSQQTGIKVSWRHTTLRSISASLGDWVKRQLRQLHGIVTCAPDANLFGIPRCRHCTAACAKTASVNRTSKPKTRAILDLMLLNRLAVYSLLSQLCTAFQTFTFGDQLGHKEITFLRKRWAY